MNHNIVDLTVCLTCAPDPNEMARIEWALSGVPGVREVTLNNFIPRLVNVKYDPRETVARTILDHVADIGHPHARLVGM